MSRTLFDVLKEVIRGPLPASVLPATPEEYQVYNPLKLLVGQKLTIDRLDYRDVAYEVVALNVLTRTIDGRKRVTMDYVLDAGKGRNFRLRYHDDCILLLSFLLSCKHKEAQESGLNKAAGNEEFIVTKEDSEVTYYRMQAKENEPWAASVTYMVDEDGNGTVERREVSLYDIHYWDYHTKIEDEAGQQYLEYLFIERTKYDWYWELWTGFEINPENVEVL